MKKKLKELKWKIDSLTVFSHIKNDDVLQKLHALLDAVIDGRTDNRRETLLRLARTRMEEQHDK